MSIDIPQYSTNVTENTIEGHIVRRETFEITGIKDMSYTVKKIEKIIENYGLKVRVYRANRSAAIAGAAIPTGVTQAVGVWSAIGIGLHNLATYNPDFEIVKSRNSLKVVYKK